MKHWELSLCGLSELLIITLLSDLITSGRHLEFFSSPQALLHTYSSKDPKLILAVPTSLSHGSSRSIFSEFASVPDNVLLLTSPGEEGTLARTLFNMWNDEQRDEDKWNKGKLGRNIMLDKKLTLSVRYLASCFIRRLTSFAI